MINQAINQCLAAPDNAAPVVLDHDLLAATHAGVVQVNPLVRQALAGLQPGRLLLLGEGQHRSAVWAAFRGWQVDLVDPCAESAARTCAAAAAAGTRVHTVLNGVDGLPGNSYHAVVATFVHLPTLARRRLHSSLAGCLVPGGRLAVELFAPAQLRRGRLCPRTQARMCDLQDLRQDVTGLAVRALRQRDVELAEGPELAGAAWVQELVAERPLRSTRPPRQSAAA